MLLLYPAMKSQYDKWLFIHLTAASKTTSIRRHSNVIAPVVCDLVYSTPTAYCGGNLSPPFLLFIIWSLSLLLCWFVPATWATSSPPQLDRGLMKMASEYDYIISCVLPNESRNCGFVVSAKMRKRKEELFVGWRKLYLIPVDTSRKNGGNAVRRCCHYCNKLINFRSLPQIIC